ncbi:MAG TPA: PEGA domain-containing protein [Enhygromyxa sp.]|nr:PEGA domain-containing protein [Enhygromyxa sp.]
MTILLVSLLTSLAPAGLSFGESIPAHERARLNEVFLARLQELCEPPPCSAECDDEQPTISLELGGDSRDYRLRWLVTAPDQRPRQLDSSCELCNLVELEQRLADDLSQLCGPLATGTLTLSSEPADARVRVDGRRAGRTPWTSPLPTGRHRIELAAPGHRRATRVVEVGGGEHQQLHLSLSRRPRWPGWTLLGIGIAASVAGSVLVAVDGDPWTSGCSGTNVDGEGDCRFVLRTRPLGTGLAAAGLGVLATGVGLVVWTGHDGSQRLAGIQLRARF